VDRFRPSVHSPEMQIELKQSTRPETSKLRTNYAIRISEVETGKWTANLQPDGKRPGVTLAGATAKEAFTNMLEFLFE